MRKERISDEIVSLNMYNDERDTSYLLSLIIGSSKYKYHKTYEKDITHYYTKDFAVVYPIFRTIILRDRDSLERIYSKCKEIEISCNKKIII